MNKKALTATAVVLMFLGCMGQPSLTKTFGDSGLSHFSALGFDPSGDMNQLSARVLAEGTTSESPSVPGGRYFKLAYKDGIELWAFTKNGSVEGLKPFFRGEKGNRVKIMRNINDTMNNHYGGFEGWPVLVESDGSTQEAYPFVFECPAYNLHSKSQFPRTVNLYVAVFATNITLYPDEKTYMQTLGSSPKSFVQPGGFTSNGMGAPQALPVAAFTGVVKDTKLVKNPLTGSEFRWISVETYGMTVDVVAEEKMLPKPPEIGNVAAINGWFSGDWL